MIKRGVASSLGPEHVLRPHPLLELLLVEVAQLDGLLLERGAVLVRRLGDLGGGVVADVRVQRSHQHQRLVQQSVDAIAVRLDPVLQNVELIYASGLFQRGPRITYSKSVDVQLCDSVPLTLH